MAAGAALTALVDRLIDQFNRQSLDLPDGLFTRRTQFRLNGVAYEEMLGRSPDDPLVLMLARGPAGYRFTMKAVQHAVPDARLERGPIAGETKDGMDIVRCEGWLSGHFRGTGEAAHVLVGFELLVRGGSVDRVDATIDPAALERLRDARLRP
jgi:hypothetical protein